MVYPPLSSEFTDVQLSLYSPNSDRRRFTGISTPMMPCAAGRGRSADVLGEVGQIFINQGAYT
jgi:hypothetical protein